MNRKLCSTIAVGAIATTAALAAAVITSASAYADDITVEQTQFVSTLTREQVTAQLKTPYPGGNPWSSSYNMFQSPGAATREQVQGEYFRDRDEVSARHAEDSGSAYMMKAQASLARSSGIPRAPDR